MGRTGGHAAAGRGEAGIGRAQRTAIGAATICHAINLADRTERAAVGCRQALCHFARVGSIAIAIEVRGAEQGRMGRWHPANRHYP